MAQLRDIEDSIQSVVKTKKITQAMKMVAAAKFKRATRASLKAKPYLESFQSILTNLSERIERDELPIHLQQENGSDEELAIIITGDRGLCGSFNTNIIKFAENFLKKHDKPIKLILFGNKGIQYFKKRQWEIQSSISLSSIKISAENISNQLEDIINTFEEGKVGKVWFFYNEFASALSSNLVKKQILPINIGVESDHNSEETTPTNTTITTTESDYFYEPDKMNVLNQVLSELTTYTVFKAILDSQSAEEGARMASMDAATSNAEERIKELSLIYNRTRQTKITNEISEIVAGAEALVS